MTGISMMRSRLFPPEDQADATLSQANPVSGTQYTLLSTKSNARIISIMANVTWTVQPTPLEVHMTIDGQTRTFTVSNPVSLTNYYASILGTSAELLTASSLIHRAFLIEGRSIAVTLETTGGTVQSLDGVLKYQLY